MFYAIQCIFIFKLVLHWTIFLCIRAEFQNFSIFNEYIITSVFFTEISLHPKTVFPPHHASKDTTSVSHVMLRDINLSPSWWTIHCMPCIVIGKGECWQVGTMGAKSSREENNSSADITPSIFPKLPPVHMPAIASPKHDVWHVNCIGAIIIWQSFWPKCSEVSLKSMVKIHYTNPQIKTFDTNQKCD